MAYIINAENDTRIYDDRNFDTKNLHVDNSNMDKDVEDNYVQIHDMAVKSLKKRKPYYDFKTKNKSFLDLYNDLYKMGIKNNKFHLRLYDTDLLGVDVYSPIIPPDLQLKIIFECFINPWYFLREVCRIPVAGMPISPGSGSEFLIDRNSIASWYLFLNGIDHYASKPRQRGKTQNAIAQMNYAFHFGAMASQILFFNKDQPQAAENLGRLKDQRDLLPRWMQMRTVTDENGKVDRGVDNVRSYATPVTNNEIKVMGRANSKETATKLGRGATAPLQYYDEFDFTPYNVEIIGSASFAYSTAATSAKKNNSLYARLYTSTPTLIVEKSQTGCKLDY